MHQRRGRDVGSRAGAWWQQARSRPSVVRAALLVAALSLLLCCLLASRAGTLVYPTTVRQAQSWQPRSEAAALAVAQAPRTARTVDLVISRFSGNLSWVAGVVELVGVANVIVYCKARRIRSRLPLLRLLAANGLRRFFVCAHACARRRTRWRRPRRWRARTRCPTWATRATATCGTSRSTGRRWQT
jgi:hypothetical protein